MSRLTAEHALIANINPSSQISEAYRALRINTQFSFTDQQSKLLLVTSSYPGEGKSVTTANLAVVYAQEGKKVLLIDADLRKSSQHQIFFLSNRAGLSNLLASMAKIDDVIKETHIPGLSVITSGFMPPNPAELLASGYMSVFLQEMRDRYDVILIDSPPLQAVADAMIIASQCDGVLLVVQPGRVKRKTLQKTKQNLERVKAKILGVVLNNINRKAAQESYYANYSYYGKSNEHDA